MFEDLENTLKDIRSELSFYRQLFALIMTTLSIKKQVAKFLGVSTSTITQFLLSSLISNAVYLANNFSLYVDVSPL